MDDITTSNLDREVIMTKSALNIVWCKFGYYSPYKSLVEQITKEQKQKLIDAAMCSEHNRNRVIDGVIVETATKWWTEHFRLFIYLPNKCLLLRYCNNDSWYIDVGKLWKLTELVYVWTDLELDVTISTTGNQYTILDIDQFAEAISAGKISTDMAVFALNSLHEVIHKIQTGKFPPSLVQEVISIEAE